MGEGRKRLIIMRHAKSSWNSGASSDHARPLNDRGRSDAPKMARALKERGWIPDVVISSDSRRTRETFAGLAEVLGDLEVEFTRDLYHAGSTEIIAACEELGEDVECAMVLGHNPGWEAAVGYFTGEYASMTTANCALLEGEGSWMELMTSDGWRLVTVLRPREV